jgi:hypothetical protein
MINSLSMIHLRALIVVFLLGIKGELEVLSWGSVCVFVTPRAWRTCAQVT